MRKAVPRHGALHPHPEPSEVEPQEALPESNEELALLQLSNDGLELGVESKLWAAVCDEPAS